MKAEPVRETLLHATCVALADFGVLIQGPPGSGKSDLALRLIDQPGGGHGSRQMAGQLVSDDQVAVCVEGDGLLARPPANLKGKLEIRGLGIVTTCCRDTVRLCLAVRLSPASAIERMPDFSENQIEILGQRLPVVHIDPHACSAPARVRAAVLHFSRKE